MLFWKKNNQFVSFILDGGVWSICFLICWFLVKLIMDGSLGIFFGQVSKWYLYKVGLISNMAFLVHIFSFQQSSTCKVVHFILPVSWENGNQLSLDIIFNNWKWKFQTKFICISHIKMKFMEFVKFIFNSIDKNTLKNGRKISKIFTCNILKFATKQKGKER